MRAVRMPSPLLALLGVVAVAGVAWALLQPAFQVTDEDVHFSYVHTLGELHRLPGDPRRGALASEFYGALDIFNSKAANFQGPAKPEWSESAYRTWLDQQRQLSRDDGGGGNSASTYPPAYYLSLVPAYKLARDGDLFTRLLAARLASVMWLLVSTVAAWLLVGELLGRRRQLQLAGAATVGLWPMLDYVSAGVNPDAMQTALWTLAFWLGSRLLRRGLAPRDALAFGAIVGLAMITKATSLALLPASAALLLIVTWRAMRAHGATRALVGGACALLAVAVPVVGWMIVASESSGGAYAQSGIISAEATGAKPFLWREFASYVWQFYLPRLPFQQPFDLVVEVISNHGLHNTWFGHFFGVFGWTNVWFPLWAYDLFLGALFVLMVGALVATWTGLRRRHSLRRFLPFAAFFGIAIATVLGGLHLTEYRQHISGGGPFMQGRYLLPLIGLFAVVVAASLSAVPPRLRGIATGVVLGALLSYQLGALALIVSRFYA